MKRRRILIGLACVAVIGVSIWGYRNRGALLYVYAQMHTNRSWFKQRSAHDLYMALVRVARSTFESQSTYSVFESSIQWSLLDNGLEYQLEDRAARAALPDTRTVETRAPGSDAALKYDGTNLNWYRQNGDNFSTKFSSHAQITRENAGRLRVAWPYSESSV